MGYISQLLRVLDLVAYEVLPNLLLNVVTYLERPGVLHAVDITARDIYSQSPNVIKEPWKTDVRGSWTEEDDIITWEYGQPLVHNELPIGRLGERNDAEGLWGRQESRWCSSLLGSRILRS